MRSRHEPLRAPGLWWWTRRSRCWNLSQKSINRLSAIPTLTEPSSKKVGEGVGGGRSRRANPGKQLDVVVVVVVVLVNVVVDVLDCIGNQVVKLS